MRGISAWGRAAALVLGLGLACALAFPDGAPPGHTGGFGEPNCGACHFGGDSPADETGLRLKNLGDTYKPGRIYEFVLHLADPGKVGGFQMSVRFNDAPYHGQSAGRLESDGDRLRVVEGDKVQYLGHREVGRRDHASDDIRWRIRWTAPEKSGGGVIVHIAAVAGDDDESPIGDTVYALTRQLQPD